jgi:hypothetical protein
VNLFIWSAIIYTSPSFKDEWHFFA